MLRGKGPALTWLPLPQPSFSAKGRLLGEAFLDTQQVTPSTTWDPTALSSRTSPLAVLRAPRKGGGWFIFMVMDVLSGSPAGASLLFTVGQSVLSGVPGIP